MSDALDLLLPLPVYLVALLTTLTVFALISKRLRDMNWLGKFFVAATIWAWFFTNAGIANYFVAKIEGDPASQSTVRVVRDDQALIVILASGNMRARNGSPSARLDAHGWERLHAGLGLWKRIGGRILMTGGPGEFPDQSLAALMQRTAIESGVPPDVIDIEPTSNTTYEDLLYSRNQIQLYGNHVWLVTSALHMRRAEGVAKQLDLAVRSWRCDYRQIDNPTWRIWLPDNGAPRIWADLLHEIVGAFYYRLRGWSK